MKKGTHFVHQTVELPSTEAVIAAQKYIVRGGWLKNPYHNYGFARMTALRAVWIAEQMETDVVIDKVSLTIAAFFCRFEHVGFISDENCFKAIVGLSQFFADNSQRVRGLNFQKIRKIVEESYPETEIPTLIESYILRDAIRMKDPITILQDCINETVVENRMSLQMARSTILRKITRRFGFHTHPAMLLNRNIRDDIRKELQKWESLKE